MKRSHHIRFVFVMFLFVGQFFTFCAKADNLNDLVLVKQVFEKWVISPSDGYILDTCCRLFNYSENGTLKTIVDTPKSIFHAAYFAEFDKEGKIKSYKEYFDTLTNTTEFYWESGNKIRFERQWTDGQKQKLEP